MVKPKQRDWRRVGWAVALRRGELGLRSQKEAADSAGVGVTTWRQIEGAKQTEFRPAILAAVARALAWPPNALITIAEGGEVPTGAPKSSPTVEDDDAEADPEDVAELLRLERELEVLKVRVAEELRRRAAAGGDRVAR